MEETVGDKLTKRQEKFCQVFTGEKEFFGNGVSSYLEVYEIDQTKPNWYKTACACASRLLSNDKVSERISELLEEQGLNDFFVDKQLKFLLTQYADFGNKLGAIKEYNKLKQRILERTELTVVQPIYGGKSNEIPRHNSDQESIQPNKED